jgi:hypothetical protein
MVRTLTFGILMLAAAAGAAADETATAPRTTAAAAVAAVAANTVTSARPVDAKKQRSLTQAARTKPTDGKPDPAAAAGQGAQPGDVKMSGMSILGNEDTPKSLALVPWRSSELGDMPSVSRLLDSSPQPVDKDVFMRELAYYSFKSGSK